MRAQALALAALAGVLAGTAGVQTLTRFGPGAARIAERLAGRARTALEATVAPLRRAASHGQDPSARDRRRLRVAGVVLGAGAGLLLAGPVAAAAASVAAAISLPRIATWRRARYARRVEEGAGAAALAISAALAGGGSIPAAIGSSARELEGPVAVELERTALALAAGASIDGALDDLAGRVRSPGIVRIAAAVQLQRRSGGDLAGLLRRLAAALEDERRVHAEARAATAQARVTSAIVVALPPAALGLAELASPGTVARMLGSGVGAALVAVAVAMQAAAGLAVRRIARIEP